jgi:hypothetical protein
MVTAAVELKSVLLDGLASGGSLCLDLETTDEADATLLQLLWAAGREAEKSGTALEIRLSDAAGKAARDAGFARFPG